DYQIYLTLAKGGPRRPLARLRAVMGHAYETRRWTKDNLQSAAEQSPLVDTALLEAGQTELGHGRTRRPQTLEDFADLLGVPVKVFETKWFCDLLASDFPREWIVDRGISDDLLKQLRYLFMAEVNVADNLVAASILGLTLKET